MTIKKSSLPEKDSRFAYLANLSPSEIDGIQQAATAPALERSWSAAMSKHAPAAQVRGRRYGAAR
ncbi:hypothetical protein [Pandoraea terrigena]|uniref:Uncharacterized protein n=1 Tax=Pandoraea terrigena TaxID=2508292 RepID=A0A5E4UTE8_9BURK|nr:hypothetical protein [Pandoraea terrigena]VVE01730.1 hypothetical protein PTE31013_02178 [Pandoraea terrigena]